jgi:hypothetical protein
MSNALQERPSPANYEEHMIWRTRWFLIRCIPVLYGFSLLSGLFAYAITKDSHYLLFASPTLFLPAAYYLIPMDEHRYHLKLRKIEVQAELKRRKTEAKLQNTLLSSKQIKQGP